MRIKVIRTDGRVALVEYWTGSPDDPTYHRTTVPVESVAGDDVPDDEIAFGVPYGLDWAARMQAVDFPALVANELRRRGIYTGSELLARPDESTSAYIAAARVAVAGMIDSVRREVVNNGR